MSVGIESPLTASVEAIGCKLVITLHGEVDIASVEPLDDAIEQVASTGDADVIVDLCGVRFMDSTALNALLRLRALLAPEGRRVVLACTPAGPVARLLQIAVVSHFDIHDSLKAALAAS